MDVLDAGVPILSMHAPFELASKVDIYSAYRAYKVLLGTGAVTNSRYLLEQEHLGGNNVLPLSFR